jgi:hypothetical protein
MLAAAISDIAVLAVVVRDVGHLRTYQHVWYRTKCCEELRALLLTCAMLWYVSNNSVLTELYCRRYA